MSQDAAALSRVVCDIYDAAVDPALWPNAMRSSCRYIGGSAAIMFWHDAVVEAANLMYQHDMDPVFSRLYVEKYVALNPVFPAALFSDVADVGRVHSATDIVPQSELEQTRFYKEWVEPQGITDTLAVTLDKERARGAFFALHWKGASVDHGARERMALLVPHLQRAVAIGRLFVKHGVAETALTETLNHLDAAVVLVSADGDIVFANAVGLAMIEDGVLLRRTGRSLAATNDTANRALRDGLRAIETGGDTIATRGFTVVLSDARDHRWLANVLPLVDGLRKRAGEASDAIAAVFVRNYTFAIPTSLEILSRSYRLTASEIRVVDATLKVSGVKSIAETLGISTATVKTHLNRIYRKCGARNQGDLIKLVLGIGGEGQSPDQRP